MAKEHLAHFLEGQSNKWRCQSQNWTTQYGRHTQWKKTPLAWTCDTNGSPAHTSTGTGRFQGLREVQVVHVQTGGAQSTRTCYGWESPGKKWRWQLKTDQNGVGVWPNASTWMWVESRSRSFKLEEHSQQGLVKDGNHLERSGGGSSKQIRMTSQRGPMHPLGCGLNQGQGQA